ncbi:MAG: fumarylacetoacetate hydrolase family protein [Acidobacteriales bacterium]|nr:fumarylacetoacetate hydrolase family protein [Terriglobales bacterium]
MRYCRFQTPSGPQFGKVESRNGADTITSLLNADFSTAANSNFQPIALAEAKLLAPTTPSKIICVGRNYREHASEMGNDVPVEPLIFFKPPSSVIGPGDSIKLPPSSLTQRVDYEGELALIIAKRCSKLTETDDIRQYIRGYTCANDVTARDLQKKDSQWTRAKGFDTFCPVGPIVTDEIDVVAGVDVSTTLNGEVKQRGNTREFIFGLDVVLRFISAAITLEPGDLILTGTPAGVSPMKSGDVVEVTISGIGTLLNRVE